MVRQLQRERGDLDVGGADALGIACDALRVLRGLLGELLDQLGIVPRLLQGRQQRLRQVGFQVQTGGAPGCLRKRLCRSEIVFWKCTIYQ